MHDPAQDVQWLNREQLAKMLGVAKATIDDWHRQKKMPIPYTKIGRITRYRLSDVQAFLASKTSEPDI